MLGSVSPVSVILQFADLRSVLQSHGERSEDTGRTDGYPRRCEDQSGGEDLHL